ncbi:MAG TPA: DUF2974 domain-containing protein [Candidatus Limiplasma sp.]|nr:DUF2974 domain-containing protein [Candidatus Limiplasma sp.]HRX09085.1 DUF2974 domain-containing protein [Candidatus Limiplasma sp.]
MYNIQSHVEEIGTQTFSDRSFDTLDSLVLSHLSYIPMEGFLEDEKTPTLQTLGSFAAQNHHGGFVSAYQRKCYDLLQLCAASKRYGEIDIIRYHNNFDPDHETQFSATTFALPGDVRYIAFRGTDVSLVGWKEDFNMSFMTVPAQLQAVNYTHAAAGTFGGDLYLGGHSKGGNLALYAACHVNDGVRKRIGQVFSFDGPGVDKPTLDSPQYQAVRDRVESWVPQSSVVGMLLCYHPDYLVVRSEAIGLAQHDAFTWRIQDGAFQQLQELNLVTRRSNEAFNHWLDQQSQEERRFMVDVIFKIVSGIGIDNVSPLIEDFKGNTLKMFSAFNRLELETRVRAMRLLAGLLSTEAGFAVRQLLANVFRTQTS